MAVSLKAVQAYRTAGGSIWGAILMGTGTSVAGALLVATLTKLADWWVAVLAVLILVAIVAYSVRAWYGEWKRAEALESDLRSARVQGAQLQDSELENLAALSASQTRSHALRLIAEYLAMNKDQSLFDMATALHPFAYKVWMDLDANARAGGIHPVARAFAVILTLKNRETPPETITQAVQAIAASHELAHLVR
jgi:hypothetical protein